MPSLRKEEVILVHGTSPQSSSFLHTVGLPILPPKVTLRRFSRWYRDEMLLGALAMGAEGAVGSTYNVIAPVYLALIEAFRRGDMHTARTL